MKKQIIFLASFLVLFCSCNKKEKLLIGGSDWNQIAIIDKSSGKIEWKQALAEDEECNDLEITSKGEILYAFAKGARLIDRNGKTIWEYFVKEGEELHTATQLKTGEYLVAVCGTPARIVELDKSGKPVKDLTIQIGIPNVRHQFRQILKTPKNTYILPLLDKHKVIEVDEEGKTLKSIYTGGTPCSVKLLDNGNWLISGGEGAFITEVNPETKEKVRNIEKSNISWGSLHFVGELIPYSNGNLLVANWNGNSQNETTSPIIEIDPENKVVWRLPLNLEIQNITTIYSFFE